MSKTTLDIKDVPKTELDRIRDMVEADPRVRQLRVKQNILQRQGNIPEAISIGKQINEAFYAVVAEVMAETDKECENVDLATVKVPEETADKLNEIIVTLQLAIDIVDTCIMDFNETLHSADSTLTLESFDDIRELGQKVRTKLDYFSKKSKVFKLLSFADKSDNMYGLLRSKARSLINKKK